MLNHLDEIDCWCHPLVGEALVGSSNQTSVALQLIPGVTNFTPFVYELDGLEGWVSSVNIRIHFLIIHVLRSLDVNNMPNNEMEPTQVDRNRVHWTPLKLKTIGHPFEI